MQLPQPLYDLLARVDDTVMVLVRLVIVLQKIDSITMQGHTEVIYFVIQVAIVDQFRNPYVKN